MLFLQQSEFVIVSNIYLAIALNISCLNHHTRKLVLVTLIKFVCLQDILCYLVYFFPSLLLKHCWNKMEIFFGLHLNLLL